MARKYLNEIGLPDEVLEGLGKTDLRWQKWNQQIKEWGLRRIRDVEHEFYFEVTYEI